MSGLSYAIVSGKGGVGKSMLAVALGAQWAAKGKRVALVDLNTGMRGLDMLLGLESRIVFDLGDVLDGYCEVWQALVKEKNTGLHLIAARQISDSEALDEDGLAELTHMLCGEFDMVLLDAATGIGRGFTAAARAAQKAILVVTPDDAALRDGDRVIGLLQRLDMPPPHVIINRIRADLVSEGLHYTPEVCAQALDTSIRGVIPEDDMILRCALQKRPAVGDFPGAAAIANAMARLENRDVPLLPWRKDERESALGFWERRRRRPESRNFSERDS